MQKIRMGVIGCGGVSQMAHIPYINEISQAELVTICDISGERVKSVAAKWGVEKSYTDYSKMLEKEDLDAVVVATPNLFHYEQAIAAAEAGLHTLVEKPLACTNKEAWEVVDAFDKANKKLMIGCDRRFWLQSEMCKELIDLGFIGDIKMSRSTMHELYSPYQENISLTDFRLKPAESGAGTLFDQGSHKVDLVKWLVGKEVKRVMGSAKRLLMSAECPDDIAWVLMELEDETISCVSTNRFSPTVSEVTELYGTEGTIYISSDASHPYQSAPLAVYTSKDYNWDELPEVIQKYRYPQSFFFEDLITKPVSKRWVTVSPPREWSYKRMMNHFVDCILSDKEPLVTGKDGAEVMEILCAVFKSMESGGWVDLPLEEEIIPPHYQSRRKGV